MIKLREIVMIHELKKQGLGISEIARRTGLDRKTVRKHLRGGLQSARYGPRQPRAPAAGSLRGLSARTDRRLAGIVRTAPLAGDRGNWATPAAIPP